MRPALDLMPMTANRPNLVPIDRVAGMLAQRIEPLCRELLPAGRRDGHEWRCGSLAGEAGQSMAVHLTGGKAGVWSDFASGEKGDALDLVGAVLFRGDLSQALRWARQWLGLDRADPAGLQIQRRLQQQLQERAEVDDEKTRRSAWALWLNAQPQLEGTPVEYYLAGRGIDLAGFERAPRAIRYHPALFNVERQAKLPAMLTAIHGRDGVFAACHRTWLENGPAGPADWRKARLEKPKMVLGRYTGACIRLWRGASGKTLAEAPPGECVDIVEGIEDGLSVAAAHPECRVVAAVSLSNMGNLVFPPAVTRVCLWLQNDREPAALRARDKAVQAFLERGIEVVVPSIPGHLKDVNDLAREQNA